MKIMKEFKMGQDVWIKTEEFFAQGQILAIDATGEAMVLITSGERRDWVAKPSMKYVHNNVMDVFDIGERVYSVLTNNNTPFTVTGFELAADEKTIRVVVSSDTKRSERTRYAYLPTELSFFKTIDLSNVFSINAGGTICNIEKWLQAGAPVYRFYINRNGSKIKVLDSTATRCNLDVLTKQLVEEIIKLREVEY